MNTDGNLAALEAHLRDEELHEQAREALEQAQQELADAMYDAYMTGSQDVITEVDDALADDETHLHTLKIIREAMTEECKRPLMGRGCVIYKAIERQLGKACESIAGRCDSVEKVENFYGEFGL